MTDRVARIDAVLSGNLDLTIQHYPEMREQARHDLASLAREMEEAKERLTAWEAYGVRVQESIATAQQDRRRFEDRVDSLERELGGLRGRITLLLKLRDGLQDDLNETLAQLKEREADAEGKAIVLARWRKLFYDEKARTDSVERELAELRAELSKVKAAWQQATTDLSRELLAAREVVEAAEEARTVLRGMLDEDGWPPKRLAPRLYRLAHILDTRISNYKAVKEG